jgi:protoporphyrinogen oxidase
MPTLILGAGPAGLTAGYLLAKQGHPVIVFEAEDQVGGIAKTEVRDGPGGKYRFDLGGHRFFTKVQEVDELWEMSDLEYSDRVATIKSWLAPIENLQQVGRNGLHRYNNSDHSMLTAMRAVDNLLLSTNHDIWAVNAESVYHEEATAQDSEQPYIKAPETPAQSESLGH